MLCKGFCISCLKQKACLFVLNKVGYSAYVAGNSRAMYIRALQQRIRKCLGKRRQNIYVYLFEIGLNIAYPSLKSRNIFYSELTRKIFKGLLFFAASRNRKP